MLNHLMLIKESGEDVKTPQIVMFIKIVFYMFKMAHAMGYIENHVLVANTLFLCVVD